MATVGPGVVPAFPRVMIEATDPASWPLDNFLWTGRNLVILAWAC